MKTLIKNTSLLVILTILFSINLSASIYNFTDETYIDDIPFNTTEVLSDIITEQNLVAFDFEEESYIDDIPFDTECISIDCLYQKAIMVEFNFEDEGYIDDIEL
ncbi:MAG: hypothetical protein H8E34_00560 [Bacteroidetes bacterium]|nr:hypothetical protein [Bacteroidota bacterium]MBL6944099.1 hypothetical protein [Bacteroidales bacterium]